METNEIRPPEPLKFSGLKVEVRPSDTMEGQMIQLEKALKIFKRKMEREDIIRMVKDRRYYTKPSAIKRAEAKKLKNRKR